MSKNNVVCMYTKAQSKIFVYQNSPQMVLLVAINILWSLYLKSSSSAVSIKFIPGIPKSQILKIDVLCGVVYLFCMRV